MNIINVAINNISNDNRVLNSSRTLQNFGHKVGIVGLHDSGLAEKEILNGVMVHRLKLRTKKWSKHKFVQMLKFLEFILRFIKLYRKVDILHCNDLDGLIVGVCCKITSPMIKIVYDSHEFASNQVPNESRSAILFKRWLEGGLIKYADSVINVSDSIANEYARLYKIEKPSVLLNCPCYFEQPKRNIFRERFKLKQEQSIFLYQGVLAEGRGIHLLLDVFSDFNTDNNVIIFMGYGALEGVIKERSNLSNNIYYHPAVKPEVLLDYTSSADYGVSFIEGRSFSDQYCLPNKLFEYFMAGLPVLTSNLFEMKKLVESEDLGVVAEENSSEGLRSAMVSLLNKDYEKMQKNVIYARRIFCWEEQEKILKQIYCTI